MMPQTQIIFWCSLSYMLGGKRNGIYKAKMTMNCGTDIQELMQAYIPF